jgi:multimeric flavodoxin WrbA
MTSLLAINGSYRDDGITDQMVAELAHAAREAGIDVEIIFLRDYPIEFCLNCRECTQSPGEAPGKCIQDDGMHELVSKIERADAFILAAPTNFGSVTAVFKRFMERLIVYAYWPWGMPAPKFRKAHARRKKAILVSSCAAPGIMGRLLYTTSKQLKMTAKTLGADVVGSLVTGLVSNEAHKPLPQRAKAKADRLIAKLL